MVCNFSSKSFLSTCVSQNGESAEIRARAVCGVGGDALPGAAAVGVDPLGAWSRQADGWYQLLV